MDLGETFPPNLKREATIVRIKHLTQIDPGDIVIINYKMKDVDSAETRFLTIFRYAGNTTDNASIPSNVLQRVKDSPNSDITVNDTHLNQYYSVTFCKEDKESADSFYKVVGTFEEKTCDFIYTIIDVEPAEVLDEHQGAPSFYTFYYRYLEELKNADLNKLVNVQSLEHVDVFIDCINSYPQIHAYLVQQNLQRELRNEDSYTESSCSDCSEEEDFEDEEGFDPNYWRYSRFKAEMVLKTKVEFDCLDVHEDFHIL